MPEVSRIDGHKQLQAVMRKLPDQLQERVLGSATRAGAKELQRAAYARLAVAMESRFPRPEDVLIRKRRNPAAGRGGVLAVYEVGPPKSKPQLRWLNNGTEPHIISAVTRYGTRRGARNSIIRAAGGSILTDLKVIFGPDALHPGQPAHKWLDTAVFKSQQAVFEEMAKGMRRALPRVVRALVSEKYRSTQIRGILGR